MRTIVWDIDDVLNDLMGAWLEQGWKRAHPTCVLGYDQLTENPPCRLLGASLEDYLASLDTFRLERAATLAPAAETLAWFEQHGTGYRHAALTAAPLLAAHVSAAWVTKHFGRWIRTVAFVPSQRAGGDAPEYESSKGEYLAWWGRADLFIDDDLANVATARRHGVSTLLAPKPWNSGIGSLTGLLGDWSTA